MNKVEQYLKTELEKEKNKSEEEFKQKKVELKQLWEEKIKRAKEEYAHVLALKKEAALKNAREAAEQNFYRAINKRKADLLNRFAEEAIKLLRGAEATIKDKVISLLILSLKKKNIVKNNGIFFAAPDAVEKLKESFPQNNTNIKENKDIVFGFRYVDDVIEVEATEEAIVKKYIEKS